MTRRYRNRTEAGRQLAEALRDYEHDANSIVLALPRGGVPVAYEVAQSLKLPLDVMTVRKLGTPGHEEMAMGAIASGGVRILNQEVVQALQLSEAQINDATEHEHQELQRREALYREGRAPLDLTGRKVILVDDGLATGATMQAAIFAAQQHHPERVVVAVPVAPQQSCDELRERADEVVCLQTPSQFRAVGLWYENFEQTTDQQVRSLLKRAADAVTT